MDETSSLRRLADEAEIRRVLLTYCRGIDRADSDLIGSIYHEDGLDIHGSYKGPGRGFGPHVLQHHAEMFATMHLLGDSIFEFDGEVAHVETYVRATHVRELDGEWMLELFFGRYLDRFERRERTWKVARRIVVRDFMGSVPITPMMPDRAFQGTRDRGDPSYAHLAMEELTVEQP